MDNEERVNELSNLGNNARPKDIREANSILNQYKQQAINSYQEQYNQVNLSKELQELKQNFYELNQTMNNMNKNGNIEDKTRAAYIKEMMKELDLVRTLNRLRNDTVKVEADAERINNGLVDSYKDIADGAEDLEKVMDTFAVLKPLLNAFLENAKDLNKEFKDAKVAVAEVTKAENKKKQEANKESHNVGRGLEKTGGQSMDKAMAKEWKQLGNSLKDLINMFNIDALAKTFAPNSRQQLQRDMQKTFNLTSSEFNVFKSDLFRQVDTGLYRTDEILSAMESLRNLPVGNMSKKYFQDLLRGQQLLGMSAQTQETLLKLGNITGRNELKFYTGQFAKYMNSSLGLNEKQLDELVNMNASLTQQAADIGIATEAFSENTLNEAAAIETTAPGYGNKYNQFVQRMLSDDSFANLVFGTGVGELAGKLETQTPLELLRNSTGTAADVFRAMQTMGSEDLQNYRVYASKELGIDDNTWSLMMMLNKHQEELTKNLMTADEASRQKAEDAMKSLEQKRTESMTSIEQTINRISNAFAADTDWTFLKGFEDIENLLIWIAGIIVAKGAVDSASQLLSGGKGAALLGKAGSAVSGLTIGNATGVAALGTGAMAVGGLALGAYDAYQTRNWEGGWVRGAFLGTGHSDLSSDENKMAVTGNAAKYGLIGAAIGTAIAPGLGTAIGAGVGAIAGIITGVIGTGMEKNAEELDEQSQRLAQIQQNTYQTAMNTYKEGMGIVYRYRGVSNYSSEGGIASLGMGDISYPRSSRYGYRGVITTKAGKTNPFHSGDDYAAPQGTPLYSNVTGTVLASGKDKSGAYYVGVTGSDGYTHWYWHMMKPAEVSAGARVRAGQLVGYVGQTGYATGPHLHYTVTKPGATFPSVSPKNNTVDPSPFFTKNIFNGSSAATTEVSDSVVDLSSAFRTQSTTLDISKLGDISNPIVNSIGDLKNTIIALSEQTSRNKKIMDALVNRTIQSPTI